ncbi:uncharacterized protein [Neodiprion pinetum]|uniref:uncharacterized protein n=1 Tax=Neodiprion pinetum TaxID=441929 RepID=UPI00371B2174
MSKVERYLYQLVNFKNTSSTQSKLLDIDILPSTWITFDVDSGQCVGKFMPPPYNDEQGVAAMHDLVKNCAPPPKTWPTHPLELRGQAKTYNNALEKLEILRKEKYAYTSDSDKRPEETAKELERSYRPKNIKIDVVKTQALFDVPELSDEIIESDCSSVMSAVAGNGSDRSTKKSSVRQSRNRLWEKKARSPSVSQDSSDCNDCNVRASSQAINALPKSVKPKPGSKKDFPINQRDMKGKKKRHSLSPCSHSPDSNNSNVRALSQPIDTSPKSHYPKSAPKKDFPRKKLDMTGTQNKLKFVQSKTPSTNASSIS